MTDYVDRTAVAQKLLDQQTEIGRLKITILRVAELARRWEHVPGKQDAARQLLTALGIRKERE